MSLHIEFLICTSDQEILGELKQSLKEINLQDSRTPPK